MTPTDLRAWRNRMGYTQTQAARAMGVSLSSYAKIECGMRPVKAYHVKLAEFLETGSELRSIIHDAVGPTVAWASEWQTRHGTLDLHPKHQALIDRMTAAVNETPSAPAGT